MKISILYPTLSNYEIESIVKNKKLKEGFYEVRRNKKGEVDTLIHTSQNPLNKNIEWFTEVDLSMADTIEQSLYMKVFPVILIQYHKPQKPFNRMSSE